MIATTIEQSERLIACGVKVKTADMYRHNNSGELYCDSYSKFVANTAKEHFYSPSWSLLALLTEVLPRECDGYNCKLFISPWGNNGWSLRYHNDLLVYSGIESDIDMIEACVKMVELLHEKGLLPSYS